jgi:hypothetical protein
MYVHQTDMEVCCLRAVRPMLDTFYWQRTPFATKGMDDQASRRHRDTDAKPMGIFDGYR